MRQKFRAPGTLTADVIVSALADTGGTFSRSSTFAPARATMGI